MNAQERMVMKLHEKYNVPLKYKLHYQDERGVDMGTNKINSTIGKIANELLAMSTILANSYILKTSNSISEEEKARLRSLCDKFIAKSNNLVQPKGLYVEWNKKKNPTFFIITRKFKPVARITLSK